MLQLSHWSTASDLVKWHGLSIFHFVLRTCKNTNTNKLEGEWEDVIVSNVAKVIPESVKQTWHDWRTAMKKAEKDVTGQEAISDGVEMAGWGVEEADAKNKSEASMYNFFPFRQSSF